MQNIATPYPVAARRGAAKGPATFMGAPSRVGRGADAGLSEDLIKAQERTRLQLLTAPVDSTVQQLAVYTVGGDAGASPAHRRASR